MNQERGCHHRDCSQPHRPPRNDDSEYTKEARKHDGMTSTVVKALSHIIAHRGTQTALENPKDGMERPLFMNEPRWKALTEKHTIDYCAWDYTTNSAYSIFSHLMSQGFSAWWTRLQNGCNANFNTQYIKMQQLDH